MTALEKFRAELATYVSADSPPARIMDALGNACAELRAAQADLATRLETLPLGDVEEMLLRAARRALLDAAPGVERVRRWQRWSSVALAAVVGVCALFCAGVLAWEVIRVRPDEPSVVAQCADPGHQYVVHGGLACRAWVRPPKDGL